VEDVLEQSGLFIPASADNSYLYIFTT